MSPYDRYRAVRLGGNVRRYHASPLVGEQTNAHHSFNVAQLLLAVTHPSRDLLICALHHDVPEGTVGDVPHTSKRAYHLLRRELEKAERDVMERLGLDTSFTVLTTEDAQWLQFADLLECCCFAHDQILLGNATMRVVFARALTTTADHLDDMEKLLGAPSVGTAMVFLSMLKTQATIDWGFNR